MYKNILIALLIITIECNGEDMIDTQADLWKKFKDATPEIFQLCKENEAVLKKLNVGSDTTIKFKANENIKLRELYRGRGKTSKQEIELLVVKKPENYIQISFKMDSALCSIKQDILSGVLEPQKPPETKPISKDIDLDDIHIRVLSQIDRNPQLRTLLIEVKNILPERRNPEFQLSKVTTNPQFSAVAWDLRYATLTTIMCSYPTLLTFYQNEKPNEFVIWLKKSDTSTRITIIWTPEGGSEREKDILEINNELLDQIRTRRRMTAEKTLDDWRYLR